MAIDGGLRPVFRDKLRVGFDWTSIETGGTGRGVPDSNYCALRKQLVMVDPETYQDVGVEGWIEFKQTAGWACTLRPEQVAWLVRRTNHGGRAFVATRRRHEGHSRSDAVDELWMHEARFARELKDGGLKAAPHWVWHGGPSNWNWDEVRAILTL